MDVWDSFSAHFIFNFAEFSAAAWFGEACGQHA